MVIGFKNISVILFLQQKGGGKAWLWAMNSFTAHEICNQVQSFFCQMLIQAIEVKIWREGEPKQKHAWLCCTVIRYETKSSLANGQSA